MNKLLLPALLYVVSHGVFAQVENGNFEEWTKPLLFTHPYSTIGTSSSNYHTFVKDGSTNVNQVEEEDNSFMRIENMTVNEVVEPGYFLFGNDPEVVNEDLVFEGGFEITDTQISGITMDMKMEIPVSNPGIVIVQFKHEGSPIGVGNYATGTYVFPISGNSDWTSRSFNFDSAIDPSTDQCVIGVASADLISNDAPFIEGAFVEIDNIELVNSSDVVNGAGFEFWNFIASDEIPKDVEINMNDLFNPSYEKTVDAHDGIYAIKLTSMVKDGEVIPSTAFMGSMNSQGEVIPTAQLQSNHSLLSFYYKYLTDGSDMASVKVVFYNDMDGVYQPVHLMEANLQPTSSDYEIFEYDFTEEKLENFPDASLMTIEFSSSSILDNNIPIEGSELFIDEIALSGSLGIMQALGTPALNQVFAYPNPTEGRVSFRFRSVSSGHYKVYSPQGMLIATEYYQSVKELTHQMAPYAAGSYTFKFYDNNGVGIARVIRQ